MASKADKDLEEVVSELLIDFGSKIYRLGLEGKGFDGKYTEVKEARTSLLKAFQDYALNQRIDELETIINDPRKPYPLIRLKALKAQRRTLGRKGEDG